MNNRFDSALLWSGIAFRAQNGGVAALLQAAPLHKIALKNVHACLGGFTAHCTALHYLRLAKLARRYHVRLQVQARTGLYFPLRRTLHRQGSGQASSCLAACCFLRAVWYGAFSIRG